MENEYTALSTSILKTIEDAKEAYTILTKVASSQASTSDLYAVRDRLASIISRQDTLFAFYRTDLDIPSQPPKKSGWIEGVKSIVN